MPASRSRTEHWRDSLRKVFERGGALEICVDQSVDALRHDEADRGSDVVWRVKVIALTETSIVVEPPAACGATIPLAAGVRLVGAMMVGQNRWMFHTRTTGSTPGGKGVILQMPENVERCTRRGFFRISTADLRLPIVQCWPLLDPSTVGPAEAANRAQINDVLAGHGQPTADLTNPDSVLLPEVGPMFKAKLLNISGGGLGLVLTQEESRALDTRPFLWLRVDLRPDVPAPVAVTARLAHRHIDSAQHLYAGLAFDFSHNPAHRKFIVDLFTGYTQAIMARQQGQGQSESKAA